MPQGYQSRKSYLDCVHAQIWFAASIIVSTCKDFLYIDWHPQYLEPQSGQLHSLSVLTENSMFYHRFLFQLIYKKEHWNNVDFFLGFAINALVSHTKFWTVHLLPLIKLLIHVISCLLKFLDAWLKIHI